MKNENACLRSEGEAESKQPKKKRERSLSWQNKHIVSRIFLGLFAAFVVFPIILDQLEPVHARHPQVGDHEVVPVLLK